MLLCYQWIREIHKINIKKVKNITKIKRQSLDRTEKEDRAGRSERDIPVLIRSQRVNRAKQKWVNKKIKQKNGKTQKLICLFEINGNMVVIIL